MFKKLQSTINDIALWKKGIAVVIIPILILLGTIALLAIFEREAHKSQAMITHTLEVKTILSRLQNQVSDSETGVRGYLLWKKPEYLAPYNDAVPSITNTLSDLEKSVSDNPEQLTRVETLRSSVSLKMRSLAKLLAADHPLSADDEVTVASRRSMDDIRSIIKEMDKTEAYLLVERNHEYEDLTHRINMATALLFMLALLAGISAAFIKSNSIIKRVNYLQQYAAEVSRSKPAPLDDQGNDEIGQLARSLESMTRTLLEREETIIRNQQELEEANSNLEALLEETRTANQELESFSYSVSHDLRAPLRHVAGFSELMMRNSDSLDAKNRRYLDIIISSIRQMGVLIDDLLAFSRMGRTAIKADRIDLNQILNTVIEDLSPDITDREIQWQIDPLPSVKGDRVMIQLVFQNLISNALKYSRKSEKSVISIRHQHQEKMEAITIADNGVGFDMAYVDKLFGVFQRLHSSEDYEGTGIGLATVRRIVHRHGGRVSAKGELGKGAEFTITLPTYIEAEND